MQFETSFINQKVAGPVVSVNHKDLIDFVIAQSKTPRDEVWVLLDKPEFASLRSEGIRFNGYDFEHDNNRNVAWISFEYYDGGFSVSYMPYDNQETDEYFNDPNYQHGYDIKEVRAHWIFADLIGETPISIDELI